ncbi:MAG: hypothetical protein WDN29_03920 [Methylovirgula sp.]
MARTNLLVSIHDRVALDGIAMPGGFLVTEPGVAASCIFKGPFDELHLFLPNDLIAECADDSLCLMEARIRSEAILTHDPISNQLALALLHTEHMRGSLSQLYLDFDRRGSHCPPTFRAEPPETPGAKAGRIAAAGG